MFYMVPSVHQDFKNINKQSTKDRERERERVCISIHLASQRTVMSLVVPISYKFFRPYSEVGANVISPNGVLRSNYVPAVQTRQKA